jgi:nitrite reductase (cytochrome c-552)
MFMNKRWLWIGAAVAVLAALGTFGLLALLSNIGLRQAEAQEVAFRVVEITEDTHDASVWGQNFPLQYDTFIRTVDIERTRFGGSENIQKLDKYPHLRVLWDGFPFAVDFREERGHHFMLYDQRQTERVHQFKQPGSCLNCHSSVIEAYRTAAVQAGLPADKIHTEEALWKGFEAINAMPWTEANKLVKNPISCIDCHDPKTMAVRITRPAFKVGIQELAKSKDPVPHLPSIERWRAGDRRIPYDANRDASRHEMRSLVCAQCHVEYHFDKPPTRTLIFPWRHGLKVEHALQYFDEIGWRDWVHKRSGAEVMKIQHPEFELWSQGPHSNVACADCHMPYERVGAVKITNHHARSPMLNIAQSCQTCHNISEDELLKRVETIQVRTDKLQEQAKQATVDLIEAIVKAKDAGASDEALKQARTLQRSAQFKVDWVFSENSRGFHAPQEAARILGESIDEARRGVLEAYRAEVAARQ